MHLTIDFESRSAWDLRGSNPFVYAAHPSTQIACLALKEDDQEPWIYVPDQHFLDIVNQEGGHPRLIDRVKVEGLIELAHVIEAHNSGFELALWEEIMVPRYWFESFKRPDLFAKLRCSASVCSYKALPRSLGNACRVMGTPTQKDNEGHKLMMKMCKPRKPRMAEKKLDPDWENSLFWWEEPEQVMRQMEYCMQDVNAEYALSQAVGELSEAELEVWRIDQIANWRGVYIDRELVSKMTKIRDDYSAEAVEKFGALTGFAPSCVEQLRNWCGENGYPMASVDAPTIKVALQDPNIPEHIEFALKTRQGFAKTSLAKLDAGRTCTSTDSRMRNTLMYSGANTHRWTGMGMQLQNIPSRGLIDNIDACREMILSGADLHTMQIMYPDVQLALSSVLRNTITATPGLKLFASDFASIEGRDLAWLAGEEKILQGYRDGKDMYKIAAAGIYGVTYDEVTKAQRTVGKIPELAGGYGGGWRAYMQFAVTYDMKPSPEIYASLEDEDFVDWQGQPLTEFEAAHQKWWDPMVRKWRANRPKTKAFWDGVMGAAVGAITGPGQVTEYNGVKFGMSNSWLRVLLPSGNVLYYRDASVFYKDGKPNIMYKGTDSMKGGAWVTKYTYGGKLTENIVQSVARDMMAEALVRIVNEDIGLNFLFSVHDELVFEGTAGCITLDQYNELMAQPPEWALDCPIAVEGWIGDRYRK